MTRVVAVALLSLVISLLLGLPLGARQAAAQRSVFIEELTWTEIRAAIQAGTTTVIIPSGGTEQNGPHMILGKHNIIVKFAAGDIATRLGNALVAPVVTYVPEGTPDPPTDHMRFPGTVTLPQEYYMKLLEYAARSYATHGFLDIVFIGDHGGTEPGQQLVAAALNKEWAATRVRAHDVAAYYTAGLDNNEALMRQGVAAEAIGSHAGIPDTSELMAIDPDGVRLDKLAPGREDDGSGVVGDPRRATAAYGKISLEARITAAVRAVREMRESSRKAP